MPRFDISRVPPSDCTRIGVIIISSQFLAGPKDAPLLNEQARQLVIRSVKAGAPVGLIAVTDSPATAVDVRLPAGIDWIVATKDANLSAALREGIEKVAFRLWYKAPPPPRNFGGTTADAIVLDYVRSAVELDQSFKLRYQVYDLLGYLEESIRSSASQIDVDAFDRDAIHLIARDVRNRKVVGSVRLILPSRGVNPFFEEMIDCPWTAVAQWCDELGAREKSRAVRNRLQNGTPLELPCASMKAFERLMRSKHTKLCCELSRLIVAPDYRGLDLSSRLMEIAIQLVTCLNRKIMLVECVPSHRQFYESFGFQLADQDGEEPIKAHQLRAQAITMWLDLVEHNTTKPTSKANLLIAMSSREIQPDALRKLTGRLRRDLPLELCSPNFRAMHQAMLSSSETKRMEPSESSLSVQVLGRSHVDELAQAIARLLAEAGGLSVRVQKRDADCELHASGGQAPDRKSIRNSLLKLLQWTE
jgi:GNAT superfamily N-acetyltransferase